LIHYVYRDQRRPEGLCPSADMEQVLSTGRPVQITVTDGYDLVKLFLEIRGVLSLFILLESIFAFVFRFSCQTSICRLHEDVLGALVGGMLLHPPITPDWLVLTLQWHFFLIFPFW